ncbi:MAG: hypothetical protein ACYTF7_05290 [Planctomycetota bacterium]|jgi:hypothetical protein
MTMSPDTAARSIRLALVGLIGSAVVVAGAPFLPLDDEVPEPRPVDPGEFQSQNSADTQHQPVVPEQWGRLAVLMDEIHTPEEDAMATAAQTQAQTQLDRQEPVTPTVSPQASQIRSWRYIGHVTMNETMYAVVSIDNSQRFLGIGEEVRGVTLAQISDQELTFDVDGSSETLARRRLPSARMTPAGNAPSTGAVDQIPGGDALRDRRDLRRGQDDQGDRR